MVMVVEQQQGQFRKLASAFRHTQSLDVSLKLFSSNCGA